MVVAITGGNGHIGNAIILELLNRGYQIKALAHSNTSFLKNYPVEIVYGSLDNQQQLEVLLNGADYLIHCAAVISINGDPKGQVKNVNVLGVDNLLKVAQNFPLKRVIHVSSVHAFDQFPYQEELNEKRAFVSNDAYAYDKSKRDGQLICKQYIQQGLPIVIVNPTAVFGPPNFASCKQNNAFVAMSKGKIPLVFKGGYNWVDVRDVSSSICNALENGKIGESYILGGQYFTLKELSRVVSRVSHKKIPCFEIPVGLVRAFLPLIGLFYSITKKDPAVTRESIDILQTGNRFVSSEKAKKELGHNPRPIQETMKDLLSWQKAYDRK